MYHASADTILAHSLLASLPEVRADQVGVMGISWGGVIVSTVMGLDDRIAFAIPTYGNGHKYDIPNYFGAALESHELYREVWDPMNWIESSQTPALWLTGLEENNFSHDSQASTYHQASGPKMVAVVPELGHGHAVAWERPEPYDFADSVLAGEAWGVNSALNLSAGVAEAEFISARPLSSAELIYSTDAGWTGDFTWTTLSASLSEGPAGVWTASAELPSDATAWLINAYAPSSDPSDAYGYASPEVVLSSSYQEVINVSLSPQPALSLGHPLASERSIGALQVSFTAPSYIEIVDVVVHSESHPGAFCSPRELPLTLKSPAPSQHSLELSFDNTIAGLQETEVATATVSVLWARLDGLVEEVSLPVQVTARTSFEVVYDVSAPWSSQTVYAGDQVTITNAAEVELDLDQSVSQLHVTDGRLSLNSGHSLSVATQLSVGAQGQLEVSDGTLYHSPSSLPVNGHLLVNGGTINSDMAGYSRGISGSGLLELTSGALSFTGGVPQNTLDLNVHTRISGGVAALSGQVRIGLNAPTIFEVVGDEAQLSMVRLNMGGTINKGTLRFVLNETGVSGITVPGWMNLGAAKLEVDGSAYQGGPASFVLVNSNNLTALIPSSDISISGFDPALTVSIDQNSADDWVRLVIE